MIVGVETLISLLRSCCAASSCVSLRITSATTTNMAHRSTSPRHVLPHTLLPMHLQSTPSSGTATPINAVPTTLSSIPTQQQAYSMHQSPNNAYTPQESFELVSRMGVKKAYMRIDKSFLSACSAGMILSFACATLISTNTAPWYQENAPGLLKTIAALVFPYGLVIVQMTGSDLCTGSFMYTTVAALHRRLSIWRMLRHWVVTFFGNLAGSLFVCCVIVGGKSPIVTVIWEMRG